MLEKQYVEMGDVEMGDVEKGSADFAWRRQEGCGQSVSS